MTTVDEAPRIFLTDYASYNNGKQFEFGHWVDLTDFSDADELQDYITNHFKECDRKSPLGYGCTREETMITDFENFPRVLYSESSMDFEALYEYINLDDDQKRAVTFILEQGEKLDHALEMAENVTMIEDYGRKTHYELFADMYPESDRASETCNYLTVDYDSFIEDNYTQWSYEGTDYLVNDGWSN